MEPGFESPYRYHPSPAWAHRRAALSLQFESRLWSMRRALVLAVLLAAGLRATSAQTLITLHIKAVLIDAAGQATPVARHALLISDDPQTVSTRRVFTTADGTVDVRLRPGNYTVESDQPVGLAGNTYAWTQRLTIVDGRDATLE